jgi:hypothetical protein
MEFIMKTKRYITKVALLAFSALSFSANADVLTLSEMFSFESHNNIFDYNPGNEDRTVVQESELISINRFNPELGTLTGVSISFESEWTLAGYIFATDKRYGSPRASGSGRSISRQAIRLIDPSREVERNREVVRTNCRGDVSCSSYDHDSGEFSGTLIDSSGYFADFELSDFMGTDDLDFSINRTLIADLIDCGRNDICYQRTKHNEWSGNVSVTYSYNVPEPSVITLLGIGLFGIGATQLGRKKNS